MLRHILTAGLVSILGAAFMASPVHAAGAQTLWKADGRQVTVNGDAFFAKGVTLQSTPWGSCPDFPPHGDFTISVWKGAWQRDIDLLRAGNANLIKTYNTLDSAQDQWVTPTDHDPFLDALWNGGDRPIYVLMGYGIAKDAQFLLPKFWEQGAVERENYKKRLVALAARFKDHPAVMGFVMNNELNNGDTRAYAPFWEFWNEVAGAMREAAPNKLVTMALVDDSMQSVKFADRYMTHLSFWGINSFRGNYANPQANNFTDLWTTYAAASNKPLLLTEWGWPATTHDAGGKIAPMSAQQMDNLVTMVDGHYNDILANSSKTNPKGVSIGGAYFHFTDEIWKADPNGLKCIDPKAYPACHTQVQDPGANRLTEWPGGWNDEEGYGLFGISPSPIAPPDKRAAQGPGQCVGPWDFSKPNGGAPYPVDKLTMRPHAQRLFARYGETP